MLTDIRTDASKNRVIWWQRIANGGRDRTTPIARRGKQIFMVYRNIHYSALLLKLHIAIIANQ